ncbi:MAG: sigma-54 dependent transcriptional regulator [Nitrospirota bacterium]
MKKADFRILVVDDETSFVLLLTRILQDEGYTVKGMSDAEAALKDIDAFSPHLVITDLKMPKMDGLRFMEEVRRKSAAEFVMITAFATVDTAVTAMKQGAVDYITKPLRDPGQLREAAAKVFARTRAGSKVPLPEGGRELPPLDIIFAGIERVYDDIRDAAPTDATIMLYGETGTGKSLIAKVIHYMSGRTGAFVDINCAAIPENLLESELFGYEKGAFTGAVASKQGKFERAHQGTLFLDEISEMSLVLQAKLLKVLQEKTFERLGSLSTIRTDARVIAATNRELDSLVREHKFREDLYYRLNVFPVRIPPLRQRRAHIPALAAYLAGVIAARLGREDARISEETMTQFTEYPWPGNIRELENVIEKSVITGRAPELEHARRRLGGGHHPEDGDLETVKKHAIERALEKTGGNRKEAAALLGISVRNLHYKIKEYGL